MSTTLPLFWNLSSASKQERIHASSQLVTTLQRFQEAFVAKDSSGTSDEDHEQKSRVDQLDVLNAPDVSYSIRRLIRGLASPRECSRLGFAVTLTELLSRLNAVSCTQVVNLVYETSEPQNSMTGQELRDVLFARLFGLLAVIRSGLMLRQAPLHNSTTPVSSLACYRDTLTKLIALGEMKAWLRESAWWTTGVAVDALEESDVPWKEDAVDATFACIFGEEIAWSPEKVALAAKLQTLHPKRDWRSLMRPTFKHPDLLNVSNLPKLAKILRESPFLEEGDDEPKLKAATWKPQLHFVWDILLELLLPGPNSSRTISSGSFQEFFRIVVDESLFSSSASPNRKYWGFQVFRKALIRPNMNAGKVGMLFTKNFMRCWINQLSGKDRLLNKAARQVAASISDLVQADPTLGFTFILQLTGINGSRQFDKLTKTKTIESILKSMDTQGIQKYIEWLLNQCNDGGDSVDTDAQALAARRLWVIDQLASLIRNGSIPKDDTWVMMLLDWFVVHGLFVVKKTSTKTTFAALCTALDPPFSEDLRKACRMRLLMCLAELTSRITVLNADGRTTKVPGVASDGAFWVSKVLRSIAQLETDTKHVSLIIDFMDDHNGLRKKTIETVDSLKEMPGDAARGAQLLLCASLIQFYCTDDSDSVSMQIEACTTSANQMLAASRPKSKKSRVSQATEPEPSPVDIFVDTIIGLLVQPSTYLRVVANQVFALLSGDVTESTLDLIQAQLEQRNPLSEEGEEEDAERSSLEENDQKVAESDEDSNKGDGSRGDDNEGNDSEESPSGAETREQDDSEGDEDIGDTEIDPELRQQTKKSSHVVRPVRDDDSDSDEDEPAGDADMMALDDHLAEIFKSRANGTKSSKAVDAQRDATHFKNRVLDLVDLFIKYQPESPLVLRLIFPLVDLIAGTAEDERQLSDKAKGIITSRFGKAKVVPVSIDVEVASKLLDDLHHRARKTHRCDIASALSQCSLYLCKILVHLEQIQTVLQVYQESLTDYVTRKACALNATFFKDFLRRYPITGWELRDYIIEVSNKSVNAFRRYQTFQLLQLIVALSQSITAPDRKQEFLAFIPRLSRHLLQTISAACNRTDIMSAVQLKGVFKIALAAIRHSKRMFTLDKVYMSWQSNEWEVLGKRLSTSERLKSSTALQVMCQQVVEASRQPTTDAKSKVKVQGTSVAAHSKRRASERSGEGPELTSKKSRLTKDKDRV